MSRREASVNTKGTPLERLMPERIRKRREGTGLSGAELARRAGVSPAYVSQIETGKRVPDVKVAVALARILEDDEALYSAWSRDFKATDRSGESSGSDAAFTTLYRADRFDDEGAFRKAVRSGRDIEPPRGRRVEVLAASGPAVLRAPAPAAAALLDSSEEPVGPVEQALVGGQERAATEGHSLTWVPVLSPGVDPGEEVEIPQRLRIDRMVLDPRFLPGTRLGRPFVFRADGEVARRVPDRVTPDDLVIVSRDLEPGAPASDRVFALRIEGRIALGRVARVGDRLLVLPAPGGTEMADIGLVAGRSLQPQVAGEVVAILKVRPR
jgi:transcriptional regulator with XRE-family HTH domain